MSHYPYNNRDELTRIVRSLEEEREKETLRKDGLRNILYKMVKKIDFVTEEEASRLKPLLNLDDDHFEKLNQIVNEIALDHDNFEYMYEDVHYEIIDLIRPLLEYYKSAYGNDPIQEQEMLLHFRGKKKRSTSQNKRRTSRNKK
jgi:hypothetical protein